MRITLSTSLTAAALVGALALTGCAAEPEATPPAPTTGTATASSPATAPTEDAAQVIEITIKDGKVTPAGKTVEVKVGEPIELKVTSDVAAHLHIHSTPEQSIHAEAGTTTTGTVTIERPGVVDVEVEDTGTLVVKLEAR